MSRQTQLCFITLGCAIVALGAPTRAAHASAKDINAAHAYQAKGMDLQYRILKKSGGKPEGKLKELYDTISTKTRLGVQRAFHKDLAEQVKATQEKHEQEEKKVRAQISAKAPQGKAKAQAKRGVAGSPAPRRPAAPSAYSVTSEKRPEVILDGSQVPKEIEFPGPGKKQE